MKTQRAKWIVLTPERTPRLKMWRVVKLSPKRIARQRQEPERARLDVADRHERVLDEVILERRQLEHALLLGALTCGGVRRGARAAEDDGEDRQREEQQRQEGEEQERDRDQVQLLAEAGEAAGTLGRLERPRELGIALHVLTHRAADLARLAAAPVPAVEEVLDRVAQLRLLLDLAQRCGRACSRRRPAP